MFPRIKIISLISLLSLAISCGKGPVSQITQTKTGSVIYDENNLVDSCNENASMPTESYRAVGLFVQAEQIQPSQNGLYEIAPAKGPRLCEGEVLADQTTFGFCSGFFIDQNTFVSAAHCIHSWRSYAPEGLDQDFSDIKIVLTKQSERNESCGQKLTVTEDSVYSIESIDHYVLLQDLGDYVVIKTKEILPNTVKPLEMDYEHSYKIQDSVYMLGHPIGKNLTYTTGGAIKINYAFSFQADLDAFGGNSGSPVLDVKTNKVIGILSGGSDDFEVDVKNKCYRINNVKTKNLKSFEHISKVGPLKEVSSSLLSDISSISFIQRAGSSDLNFFS